MPNNFGQSCRATPAGCCPGHDAGPATRMNCSRSCASRRPNSLLLHHRDVADRDEFQIAAGLVEHQRLFVLGDQAVFGLFNSYDIPLLSRREYGLKGRRLSISSRVCRVMAKGSTNTENASSVRNNASPPNASKPPSPMSFSPSRHRKLTRLEGLEAEG